MMTSNLFVQQVQMLMQAQQIRNVENLVSFDSGHYLWLQNNKRFALPWMTTKEEFHIRQTLNKLSQEEQQNVIKELLKVLEENPSIQWRSIPSMCLSVMHNVRTHRILHNMSVSRMGTFRSSLRRFSVMSNKIAPTTSQLVPPENAQRRSVTFNDVTVVYSITN